MKKRIILCVIICLAVLCGCSARLAKTYVFKKAQTPEKTVVLAVDNTTPHEELITKEVDIHTFIETYAANVIYGCESIQSVVESVGIECLRETQAGAIYSVHKVKQGGLLYIFYKNLSGQTSDYLSETNILRWFYVREKLSFADYEKLIDDQAVIDKVVKTDSAAQIFKNIYVSAPETWRAEGGRFVSWQYLEDGILELGYENKDGELSLSASRFYSDFQLNDYYNGTSPHYVARILEMDQIK